MHTCHFITQNIKKVCMQVSRFNKIFTVLSKTFLRETIKENNDY